jgi:hypothetical protein
MFPEPGGKLNDIKGRRSKGEQVATPQTRKRLAVIGRFDGRKDALT